MANLMITTACNFRCPYCFGLDLFRPGQPRQYMRLELFHELLDWIDRADLPDLSVHLMGGEPTLHPGFGRMLEELAQQRRKPVVFSNAATRIAEEVVRRSRELGVAWIVNCNAPETYRGKQLDWLRQHLAWLGAVATLTFNLTDARTPYGHLLDYIDRYGLNRRIKLGVALPTLEHRNVHAAWEQLPALARHILELHRQARQRGVSLGFECGVPYCLFTAEQHAELGDIQVSHCGSRLDITPAGEVINCLPLSRVAAVPFGRFDHYRQAREWFQRLQYPYRQAGSAARCVDCEHRLRGVCSACLAYGMGEYSRVPLPPLPERGDLVPASLTTQSADASVRAPMPSSD